MTAAPDTVATRPRTPPLVFLVTAIAAIGDFLFGYDTGVISGALLPPHQRTSARFGHYLLAAAPPPQGQALRRRAVNGRRPPHRATTPTRSVVFYA